MLMNCKGNAVAAILELNHVLNMLVLEALRYIKRTDVSCASCINHEFR